MAEKTENKKKERIPSAKKREIQSERRRVRNKTFRSKVKTAVKGYESSLSTAEASGNLSLVYSLVDKGVKKGILKTNKAARIKSRMTKKMAKAK